MKKVHIGRLILRYFDESGLTKKAFAEKIGLSVRHLYSVFEKESIDTALLQKIGETLNHDFFTAFNAYRQATVVSKLEEPSITNNTLVTLKLEIAIKGKLNKKEILNAVRDELDHIDPEYRSLST